MYVISLDENVADLGKIEAIRTNVMHIVSGDGEVLPRTKRGAAIPIEKRVIINSYIVGVVDDKSDSSTVAVGRGTHALRQIFVERGVLDSDIARLIDCERCRRF